MNVKHPNRASRAERLAYIVSRMRLDHDITPTKLAGELQISERTIYRDLLYLEKEQALKKRYSRREGRYLVEMELTLPPITLTPLEAMALYVAAANPSLAYDSFYASDLKSGLQKLDEALAPAPIGGDGDGAAEPVRTFDAAERAHRATIEMVRRAMKSNRKVRIRYWSPVEDREKVLVVAPYDIRKTESGWYLLAHGGEPVAIRTFKLSRVRACEIVADRFRFPRHFSADECFAAAWAKFGDGESDTEVVVRFKPEFADVIMESCSRQFQSMHRQEDGSLLCKAAVNSTREIAWWILSYGSAAEVLSPPSLRSEFARVAKELVATYG